MDAFGISELRQLLDHRGEPCVSIYMPTHATGEQGRQDSVRLKNLLQEAEVQLVNGWLRSSDARDFLLATRELPGDSELWTSRSQGLALFVNSETRKRYRLPVTFDEHVFVGHHFHVKPLLPVLTGDGRYLILTLSQNNVRLFAASRHAIERLKVPNLPSHMEEALNYTPVTGTLQVHMGMPGGRGRQAALFHGQGAEADLRKEDVKQFFQLVDAALEPVWREDGSLVMLAGVEYLLPIYREISSCPHLVDPELVGNCDYLSESQIQRRAWPLIQPVFEQTRESAAAKYRRMAGTGKATADIGQIVYAAHEGRVETLFVDIHAVQWGHFNPQLATTELHEAPQRGDEDLLDLAVFQTLLGRGTAYSVEHAEVPSGELAAATFRY